MHSYMLIAIFFPDEKSTKFGFAKDLSIYVMINLFTFRYKGILTVPDPAIPARMKVRFPLSK